jgi:hypothetical protein
MLHYLRRLEVQRCQRKSRRCKQQDSLAGLGRQKSQHLLQLVLGLVTVGIPGLQRHTYRGVHYS